MNFPAIFRMQIKLDEQAKEIEALKAELDALKNPWVEISAFSQNPEPESKVLIADKIGHIHKAKYLPNGCYSIYGVRLEKAELLHWMPLPRGSK